MLARVPGTRATRDVDLATLGGSLDSAQAALVHCGRRDLGDHLRFDLTRAEDTGLGDNQPGVKTRRLTFSGYDTSTNRVAGTVPVDVVVGHSPVGEVEVVEPANRLDLPRPLEAYPYRLYPVVDQIADKVCATMATNYPGGRPSSRVKDLVDLVVIAKTQQVDTGQLSRAIAAKAALSDITLGPTFTIPAGWDRQYRALASKTPAVEGLNDASAAEALVRELVDPALAQT